ncbi:hypothetical protein BLOT_002316 [Blomia tropicalis]|nr:hypothetical protein BLOT_002316 [Blomia tropicalis]
MKTRFQTLEIFLVVFYYVSIRLSSSSPALISTSYYNKIHQPPAPSPSRRPESIRASLSFLPFHGSHSSPSFYHQNVYLPSPSTSSSSSSFPSSGSANYYNVESNLYSDSGPTTTMMLASSSSQPTMTAIPAPKPASQLVESSSSPMGIVFGRAISSYDGNYYIPVFYPISWINNAIEANKEQMKAQKHFEKEVLLADDDDLISRNFTKSYLLNDKNNLIQPRSSIVSKEPKIVTSIEIFDLPGANRYLGLSSDNEKINSPKMKKSTKTIKTFYKKKLTLTQNEFPKIVNQTKPN